MKGTSPISSRSVILWAQERRGTHRLARSSSVTDILSMPVPAIASSIFSFRSDRCFSRDAAAMPQEQTLKNNMRYHLVRAVLVLVVTMLASPGYAQGADYKIGFVNTERLFR